MRTEQQRLEAFGKPNPETGELVVDQVLEKKDLIEQGVRLLHEQELLKEAINFNRRKLDKNTSGRTGVSWSDRCSKWVARIHENSEEFILGYFDSFDEAVRVREAAELNIYEELKPEAREYE